MQQSLNVLNIWAGYGSGSLQLRRSCDSALHMRSRFNVNPTRVTRRHVIWISRNSSHFIICTCTVRTYVFGLNAYFSYMRAHTLTLTDNLCALSVALSFSHTHTHTHGTHKIQMSPHSILCETLLSWLLPRVLLQRIGMLIKACSLKLIRHWPGSFIKIDIQPQHTQMSRSRTWEGAAEQS